MDPVARQIDQLAMSYFRDGVASAAQDVAELALSTVPKSLFVAARSLAVLEAIGDQLPSTVAERLHRLRDRLARLALRQEQLDKLGDLGNPVQLLFDVLGEAVEHIAVESFDVTSLHAARVGQATRAQAALRLLEAFGIERLPAAAVEELHLAAEELTYRAQHYQSNALFMRGSQGFVLGLKVATDQSGQIETFAEATAPMRSQGELALKSVLANSGARWEIEWPVAFEGESIGLGLYVAGLVATGELPSDPLLAATGRIDVGGRLCGVTGIPEKVRAARASGIRRVLLPEENRPEAQGLEAASGLDLIFVDRQAEVRSRLLNAVPKVVMGYDGSIRAVRNLLSIERLQIDDEKAEGDHYRFNAGNASGIVPIDVYPNGNIVVGGSGSVRLAAERIRSLVLPSKPLGRPVRTVSVPSPERRERLRQLIVDTGAEELRPTNQYEIWRYSLQRDQSRAQIILYSSHRCTLPAGQAPAYDLLWDCVAKAMEGLGGLEDLPKDANADDEVKIGSGSRIDASEPHIGTDEAGKGDYFGPLVCAAVFVDRRTGDALRALGVKDSKLLSDKAVRRLAEHIRRVAGPNSKVTQIPPRRFNELYAQMKSEGKNLNTLLAWGHTRSIEDLIRRGLKPKFAVVDQFADAAYIERKLLQDTRESGIQIIQFPKAESDIAVAAASVLARDGFLEWMDRSSQQLGLKLPKGASQQVIDVGKQLVGRLGAQALGDHAKLSFRTTEKVLTP